MLNKFLIIILSLSLIAEDEKSKSAVISGQSQVRLQSTSDVKEKRPILYPMIYPEDMSGIDNITGYQSQKEPKSVDFNAKQILIQDYKIKGRPSLSPAQILAKAKSVIPVELSKLINKPDVSKALSIIEKLPDEKVDHATQSQTISDINLSGDVVLDTDLAFVPNFTRHKMELNSNIPEQQDFYDELVYLTSLGLKLPKITVNLKEDKKIFTLDFVDQDSEDKFKNELKYFRKIAKIRKAYSAAPLPKKYLEVAQNLTGNDLQRSLENYFQDYQQQVDLWVKTIKPKAEKLLYQILSQEIRASLKKSKIYLVDYQQLLSDLIKLDYKPTIEITEQLAQIINDLQTENNNTKTKLASLQDYLEKNNFDNQLINSIKELVSDLESFQRILLTKKSLKALLKDQDLDLALEESFATFKRLFNAKATRFYEQKYL